MKVLGFTLIELLVVLSVLVCLAFFAVPSVEAFIEGIRARSESHRLYSALALARSQAILNGSKITLCPTRDKVHCVGDWKQTLMVFKDNQSRHVRNKEQTLLAFIPKIHKGAVIKATRSFAQFNGDGSSALLGDHFIYCPSDHQRVHIYEIILNSNGRLRIVSNQVSSAIC